jgi:hypothetical protein
VYTCSCSQTLGAELVLQELQRELEARAATAAAAAAELARLRARADEAAAAEAASAAVAKDNAALRRQLDEVMLSHEAAVQSKDRALAQVLPHMHADDSGCIAIFATFELHMHPAKQQGQHAQNLPAEASDVLRLTQEKRLRCTKALTMVHDDFGRRRPGRRRCAGRRRR